MQQEDNSRRFASDPQYVLSNEEQVNAPMITGMQQATMSVYESDSPMMTSQPPPYPATQTLPSMTPTFSQQMRPQFADNVISPRLPYQSSQPSYPAQLSYNVGVSQSQIYESRVPNTSNIPALSPSGQISVQSLSPGAPGMPRKSLARMMSPIRHQTQPPLTMPPPGSPILLGGRMQRPMSPLSVYMSSAQSPQRRPQVGHIQSVPSRTYSLPQSPVYPHQAMPYSYNPQQPQMGQLSPVATSPRYVDASQRGQISPGRRHSPQTAHSPVMQVQRSPFKAARQLSMTASPTKILPYSGSGGGQQHWQYTSPARSTTQQEMWENVSVPPVLPSLPVLSSDTLDLLSTLTVSTMTSPVQSASASHVAEARMQKSPLLQQHLLMPAQPIKTPSAAGGNLLVVTGTAPMSTAPPPIQTNTATQGPELTVANTEAPLSRSNLKHSVRPSLITSTNEEKTRIDPDDEIASTSCNVSTSTLSTSLCTEIPAIIEKGDKMFTPTSADGLAPTSTAGFVNRNLNRTSIENTLQADTTPTSVATTTEMVTGSGPVVSASVTNIVVPSPSPVLPPEVLENRVKLCEIHKARLQEKLELYKECLTELFFLQNGGNCMDYVQFKKRPSTKLNDYLKKMMPDNKQAKGKLRKISQESVTSNGEAMSPASDTSNSSSRKLSSDDGKKRRFRSVSHDSASDRVPKSAFALSDKSVLRTNRSLSHDKATVTTPHTGAVTKTVMSPHGQINHHVAALKGQSSPMRLKRLSRQNVNASLDESIGSQEEILERAKQEAVIQRKVVELRKQGLWTQRRLPKVQEPPRNKTHWDYLLEEMRWLAADFAQERKWKRAAARKLVRTVTAYHKEQHDKVKRAEREEQNRLRRIASTMAREIRIFWSNIGKVVEYKQRSLLDEKRQKALDLHLTYIVDQTEKYSDWLTQGLNKQTSVGSSPTRSHSSSKPGSDDDFLPQGESSDDEETIAVAEEELEKSEDNEDEVSLLKQESQLPFVELLNSLPPELIENIGKPLEEEKVEITATASTSAEPEKEVAEEKSETPPSDKESEDSDNEKPSPISLRRSARKRRVEGSKKDEMEGAKKQRLEKDSTDKDDEFLADRENDSGGDDEATMEKEEEEEADVDHEKEIKDLQAEGDMPIEELMKMYGAAFDGDPDVEEETADEDESQGSDDEDAKEDTASEGSDDSSEDEEAEEDGEEIGMDYLFKADLTKDDSVPMIVPTENSDEKEKPAETGGSSPSKEITDVAAEAASLQPTGFTLATTQVVTPIPVLLKHTLREYQHIGLDWLVTMYDKRLNGILADEMGLGKTIQTIALLAHLACDKGVWGPHLIVVPTSVMLNWEMEFKKWCPGFKILTYYGSQKERKAKRTGWTKSNAFHVCITSYKLVLQDNTSFRRKKWKYLVLDEAQNIKNFKSQRWQTLLNFNSQRRLLLTGTPLQNNLMELWSLMHFLMPHVFQSHKEFKEWFSNPLTGMIEGSQEYNEKLIKRLHKVLRPFLLRRIKKDVEKQMPNKYEHVVRCHLSKRQRFLYEDFMSQGSTKDTLESGHFMSVINILMQLRKVCNHPNLFEPRPIVSPFLSKQIDLHAPSLVTKVFDKDPFETLNLQDHHLHLPSLCNVRRYHAERVKQLRTPRKLIEELGENREPVDEERRHVHKVQGLREQLGNILKERERQKVRNVPTLNLSQQSLHLLQHGQQGSTLPVLTLPISSGGGTLQLSTSGGTTIIPSRVITIPQSKAEDSSSGGRTTAAAGQSFTLQYQTPQGTRVTIPNKQIRQLPGGVVQIMTPAATAKAPTSSGQTVVSLPAHSLRLNGDVAGNNESRPGTMGAIGTAESKSERLTESKSEKLTDERKGEKLTAGNKIEKLELKDPTSYVERLEQEFLKEHKERCMRMASVNENKCKATPGWLPEDTISFLSNIYKRPDQIVNSMRSNVMAELIKPSAVVRNEMKPIADRFVFIIPRVEGKPVDFHVSHPAPSQINAKSKMMELVEPALKREVAPFHSVNLAMRILFPEARLIQYDCGKLQVLDILLRRFWTEKHKCLIFTQMTKVLDILEAFLSHHGYRYLRMDGSTRVEQRMLLMERFNNDPRIFCFILSTRSGGIGVNLTGADTVIFYDSDWNPTMDAQAQDRCHRIGQTRDVHIYRLISERTVEENILKKANQKRLLGNLAIEGGSFTTAFFKEQAIQDLFDEPTGLESLPSVEKEGKQPEQPVAVLSKPITARQKAIAAAKEVDAKGQTVSSDVKPPKASTWEDALLQTEDKEDADAAKQLREEQDADMEEFTENADGEDGAEGVSKVHEEMNSIYDELTTIEKYALRYLEATTEEMNREELELAEEEVHRSKQDWEIAHLMALKEEEERRLEEEEDEIFYTREDAENQVYIDDVTGETMPVWFPPTPPQDDNDVFIDPISCLLYMPGPMSEDQLPVLHSKKERKRTKTESDSPGGVPYQKRKILRSDIHTPRSLFNRPQSQLKKRDMKPPKYRPQLKKVVSVVGPSRAVTLPTLPTVNNKVALSADKENVIASTEQQALPGASAQVSAPSEPVAMDTSSNKNLDWLVNEDWKLLQAVQQVLEMPLSLAVLMPAHTPNWDLVADIVNSISSVFRSPKMCKQRFENVVAPREEGRASVDISLKKKMKGTKTPTKPKISKQKTTSLHAVDNNSQHTSLYSSRFHAIKETCSKRTMPVKSSGSGQFQRNPKHTNILMDNGITYDNPLPPIQVATLRADRIARERQALEVAKQQQQLVQSQVNINNTQNPAGQVTKSAGLSTLGVSQLTAIPLSGSASNIIVNSSALSAITKKINQHSASKTTLSNTALQQTLLRTVSTGEPSPHQPQIQIQQQGQVGTMVTVGLIHRLSPATATSMTTAVATNNTITLSSLPRPSITVPGAVIQQTSQQQQQLQKQLTKQQQQRLQQRMQLQLQKQQKKPMHKAHITPQKLQITPEAMKKLRLQRQQQQQQQLEANVVTVAKVPGKQRKTASITQQDLEQLLKNQTMRRQLQKTQTAQVQIAPVHAQMQAQQVQEAAAQQAAQHVTTTKPLPITVPVSNIIPSSLVTAVNLGNMAISSTNAGTSGHSKTLVMAGQQVTMHQLQRQLLKQRMVQQQQQQQQLQTQQQGQQGQILASKVGMKQTVYAMVPAPSQGKRRLNTGLVGTSQQVQPGTQQPVQLTVTKLLQAQSMQGQSSAQVKQALTQQGAEAIAQQVRQQQAGSQQQLQVSPATIVPSSNVSQQRLITSQRQIRQIQQLASNQQPAQMILTPSLASSQQFLQRPNQNIVASISIAAASSTSGQQQMTLSSPTQQSANLSQQLQNLLAPQVLRAQSQVSAQSVMRPTGQQHQLVLSQVTPQQTLSISPQTQVMALSSPTTPTTMTLAPSLVQLPVSMVSSVPQTLMAQVTMPDGLTTLQQPSSTSVQYVTRTMPQQ